MSFQVTDSFTADASGSFDAYTTPSKAKGANWIQITPPAGHAWNYKIPGLTSTVRHMSVDQVLDIPLIAVNGAAQIYVEMDTGTGTFEVLWYRRER